MFPTRLLTLLVLFGLAACGYKGPLYLPEAKPEAARPPVLPEPAPERPVPAETAPVPK